VIIYHGPDLSTDEVKIDVIHSMVGDINESNVMLAVVSNAVIMGFNVKVENKADTLAKREKIDLRQYDIIYEAIGEIKASMEGLLEPILEEKETATLEIKQVFPSKSSKAAGCAVKKGTISRKDKVRIKRDGKIVFDGAILSLKRFKDDVKEVREGFECGMSFSGFNGIVEGDIVVSYTIEKKARKL